MFKFILVAVIFVLTPFLFAQNQNNQWRFGGGVGISFNSSNPVFVTGSALSSPEGVASIADRNSGSLLFSTNGVTVWDATNNLMQNGSGLLGGTPLLLSSTSAAVITPMPGSTTKYYIITIDEQTSSNGIRFSVVDMTLNGGLGAVVSDQKNTLLWNTTSEKLHVVPNSDGLGYWLLSHQTVGNSFLAFKITSSGISQTPIISTIGGTQGNGAGHIKVNKQFNKLAIGNLFDGNIELYNFNNLTGEVSNPIIWKTAPGFSLTYGIEFSPNGSKLYVSDLTQVYQYDISIDEASTIKNSEYLVSSNNGATIQLGINNKIYINAGTIDVINCPNNQGVNCDYQQAIFANQSGGGGYGLPQWVYYPDDKPLTSELVISFVDSCIENGTFLSINDTNEVTSILWNFDDALSGGNNTSDLFSPFHIFSKTGTYNIKLIIENPCGLDTVYQTISIINCSNNNNTNFDSGAPNVLTPNGDGINDRFVLSNLVENTELLVINRWGNLIFSSDNYENDWAGKDESGKDLVDGVYLFQLKNPNGFTEHGFVHIFH